MPLGFKEITNKDGHVYLPKSAIEAYFVQHPDIKANLKGKDANEAAAAQPEVFDDDAQHAPQVHSDSKSLAAARREGDCSAATSGAPALDTFGPSAEPRKLRLPPLQGAGPAYDAAHQDACTLARWTIVHGRRLCPPAAYAGADGRSHLRRIGSAATSAARFSTQGARAAGSMGAAVGEAALLVTSYRAPRRRRASLMLAWCTLLLDEQAPTPSHASLDAKRLAMFGLRCHEHIAEAR
ncbi:hypothetical protein T492DRAFT_915187 [Pavlovales sp. CCMP2436]|nr:hypothetical protein T492DRAFT_915187 [Pavlovales sp. CCMP2436]